MVMRNTKQAKTAIVITGTAATGNEQTGASKQIVTGAVPLSEAEYKAHMRRIEYLMLKGSEQLRTGEISELRTLSLLAQGYEQQHYALQAPTTFAGILERKMYELKLKQGDLARRLHVSPAKLSLVLSGKQKPDVALVKAAYDELSLDGNLLLQAL